jgi:hypothetical protein
MANIREHLMAVVLLTALAGVGQVEAGGRFYRGDHPYHSGYHFMPPSSAYEAVRVRPPFYRGVPAYYFPESYLGGSVPSVYPPTGYPFNYFAPRGQAGAFYMSAYGTAHVYPW